VPRKPLPEFQDRFLDEFETAELLEISVPALQQDRWKGTLGIGYHKFGSRVRYRLSELIGWAEARRVTPPTRPDSAENDDEPNDVMTARPARRGRRRRFEPVQAQT
jgi:hypothetical protein